MAPGPKIKLKGTDELEARRAQQRKWSATYRAKMTPAQKRANRQARMERGRKLILEAKSRPCADCGHGYPYPVMEFDHVRGVKLFKISSSFANRTLGQIRAEIAKCDVVCANCHRLRHMDKVLEAVDG